MNLILIKETEISPDMKVGLKESDKRAFHIIKILKAKVGDTLSAGIVNGKLGKAVVYSIEKGSVSLNLSLETDCVKPHPLTLILGLSRPPTVKKILKEATALGVEEFILCGTDTGEKSYSKSKLLQPDALEEVLIEGAQQAVSTILPKIKISTSLKNAINLLPKDEEFNLIALDNKSPEISLTNYWKENQRDLSKKIILAIGSERGWTEKELGIFKDSGFSVCKIGDRVLRTETAAITGCAICLSESGRI